MNNPTEQQETLVIRPHHLEGALHSVLATIKAPEVAGVLEKMEPQGALALTLEAEDFLLESTPDNIKSEIQERNKDNDRFHKVVEFIKKMSAKNPNSNEIVPKSEMYRALRDAYNNSPDATVIFRNVYDMFCKV